MDANDDFEAFWTAERGRLRRALVLTLGDASLASEAVDEGMVRAYQRWNRISRYQDPAGWVYRVALNWSRSAMRRRRLRPVRRLEELDTPAFDRRGDAELWDAVSRLSQDKRAVVVLRFYLDWSVPRIAEALDCRPGTVKSRLHRALEQLRNMSEVSA